MASQELKTQNVQFRRSSSTTLAVPVDTSSLGKAGKSESNTKEWLAKRFGKEEILQSFVSIFGTAALAFQIREGMKRTKPEAPAIIGGALQGLLNIWIFFSSRGITPPEGKNLPERLVNSLKHPTKNIIYFSVLFSALTGTLSNAGNIYYGKQFIDQGKDGGQKRINSGIFGLISVWTMCLGLFSKGQENAQQQDQKSLPAKNHKPEVNFSHNQSQAQGQKSSGFLAFAWHQDKAGIIARFASLGMATYKIMGDIEVMRQNNGRAGISDLERKKENSASRSAIGSAAILAMCLIAGSVYTYRKMFNEHRKKLNIQDPDAPGEEKGPFRSGKSLALSR